MQAVTSLLARAPERLVRLFISPALRGRAPDLLRMVQQRGRPCREVPPEELQRVAGTAMHGGIVAVARPQPIADFDPEVARQWATMHRLVIALDGVSNPHNLGAIARSMAFFGVHGLLLADHPAQALPSDAAYRVAEGGLDALDLYRVRRWPTPLARLKPVYRIVGTALEGAMPLAKLPRDKSIVLVLGNEEAGISAALRGVCDDVVRIEGAGAVQSLNVAASTAILLHALTR
jgi:TrmH RNA methyltransferase